MNRRRTCAWALLTVMVGDILLPSAAWALTGGPGQPEVEGFTPMGNTDMVDLFSGDFSYNIPLMDVEGYPINLAYKAGGGMEDEASWVGFGWSLNPGVVERNLRGLPDDFNGDGMERKMHLRPNVSVGGQLGADLELWAFPVSETVNNVVQEVGNTSIGLGLSLGPTFNNYEGISFTTGLSMAMKSCREGKGTFNAGLGLNSSSQDGLRVQPFASYDRDDKYSKRKSSWSLGFGMSISSRQGLTNMSFNASARTTAKKGTYDRTFKDGTVSKAGGLRQGRIGTSWDLGAQSYTPQVGLPFKNTSLSGSFKFGGDIGGLFSNPQISGFYSKQELLTDQITTPAFGYLNLSAASSGYNVQMDFNREKDGPYSSDQTSLPIAQLTNDIFSVSGQNMAGSYTAQRNEVGHVFDPAGSSGGSGGNVGVEIGPGQPIHWGVDVVVNSSTSESGDWTSGNVLGNTLRYKSVPGALGEQVFFKEANELPVELDDHLYAGLGGDAPARPVFSPFGAYDMLVSPMLAYGNDVHPVPPVNYREKRQPRSQLFTYLTHEQTMAGLGLERLEDLPGDHEASPEIKDHHISEVTVTGADGARNVYGIPAYNWSQTDVSFAIGKNGCEGGTPRAREQEGYYHYAEGIVNTGAPDSKDQYSSQETTPGYAYAWLLTAALSADYSDVDGIHGPSPGDLGTYTRFSYAQAEAQFEWRTPLTAYGQTHQARLDHGQWAITDDDKASYSFGKKELWYLDRIESRNMVAIFYRNDEVRVDGLGVKEHGVVDNDQRSGRLDSIALYTLRDLADPQNAKPIKTVHFEYYPAGMSICPGVPNASQAAVGKLTLKKVWFTYGRSQRGRTSPYVFIYKDDDDNAANGIGPGYNPEFMDRWGMYKSYTTLQLPNASYPYAEQEAVAANKAAGSWNLQIIKLPSGGTIQVDYESDDYGWVQDKDAMRMFKVAGMGVQLNPLPGESSGENLAQHLTGNDPAYLVFDIPADIADLQLSADSFLVGVDYLYFRFKVEMDDTDPDKLDQDYVSGYAKHLAHGYVSANDYTKLWVRVAPAALDGDGAPTPDDARWPMYRAAMDQLRLQYPKQAYSPDGFDENNGDLENLIATMASSASGMLSGIGNLFTGPNLELEGNNDRHFCTAAVLADSWVRLREPDRTKLGGGHRVKRITFNDAWEGMVGTGNTSGSRDYAQVYDYTTEWGTSSGVAAYEPMFGADENPWRQPVFYSTEVKLSPDERFYQEEPFGESMFPGPSIGYSRVTVRDEYPEGMQDYAETQGTGQVVNEFWTAKDFPVILSRTGIEQQRRRSNFSLLSLTGVKMVDKNHTSQGFTIETNDMHGKPKRTTVYPQKEGDQPTQPVSWVAYEYQTAPYGSALRLTNNAKVIHPDGQIADAQIGRHYEFLTDMREFRSDNTSGGMALNTETVFAFGLPVPIPIPIPKYSNEQTAYRSATLVKKIHRFGLLERVRKMENGSELSTDNLAYDARTGGVLLTGTRNGFEDPLYTLNFPAYWYYDGTGPAYRNVGAHLENVSLMAGGQVTHNGADQVFVPGDELMFAQGQVMHRVWVDQVAENSFTLIEADGQPAVGSGVDLRVLRSGRRNLLGVNMASITTLTNPLQGLQTNAFANVLQAQVVELGHPWRGNCTCFEDGHGDPIADLSNQWRYNRKGVWRLTKEHAWLTDRTRAIRNNNTDIRRDGVFSTYDPFYKLAFGQWQQDPTGWTEVRQVTEYSDRGQELENKDALGLYSAATFGYGGSLPTAVARNARYAEILTENWETAGEEQDCATRRWDFQPQGALLLEGIAHSGRVSLQAGPGDSPFIHTVLSSCPEQGCDVALHLGLGNPATFSATGGTPPYVFDHEVLMGSVMVAPVSTNTVELSGVAPLILRMTVTDANGCSATSNWSDGQ